MNAPNLGTENPMTDKEILVEQVATAMKRAVIRDDEGEFPSLFDMLDFSGENKAETVVRGLARAAIASMPHSEQVEAAYREGWRVNAISEDDPCTDPKYLQDCEDADWKESRARKALTRNVSDKE